MDISKNALVVIGASAGGFDAIIEIIQDLPSNYPVPILFVRHLSPDHPSNLAHILSSKTALEVCEVEDQMPLLPGRLHVAAPGKMVRVEPGKLVLSDCEPSNRFCPSIDEAIISAAIAYRENTIAVILSGFLDDGAKGLQVIKEHGGVTLVQDPKEAEYASMPNEAIKLDDPDSILTLEEIAMRLKSLVTDRG